ncbi:MAG: DUF1735 domain-containing protein [Rikenellaceae bacterium]
MKIQFKIQRFVFAFVAMILLSSCYDDYKNDYVKTTTYFSMQSPYVRLLEDDSDILSLKAGVGLGGKYENDKSWTVDYQIDESLLAEYASDKGFKVLPKDFYTVTNDSKMVVAAGEITGIVTFKIDKEKFMNSEDAIAGNYVLPLRIVSSDMDEILEGKDYTIIRLNYYNQYHGQYWLTGEDKNIDDGTSVIYKEADDEFVLNRREKLTTLGPKELLIEYVGEYESVGSQMKITFSEDGTKATISPVDGATITDVNGTGTYDADNRVLSIDYTYTSIVGVSHSVSDELTFSNVDNEDLRVVSWE